MRPLSLLLQLLLAGQALAYSLFEAYSDVNFFSKFDFFTDPCPTHGFVRFVDMAAAEDSGLIANASVASWGVDSSTVLASSGAGRASIRISSKTHYNHGLFIVDIAHMPDSTCGLWPAFWFLGQTGEWPQSGELDILEAVNTASSNHITAHTKVGCTVSGSNQIAALVKGDCAVSSSYDGCGNVDSRNTSYGTGFNDNGGGVYAIDWTSDAIKVWFFPRDAVPNSIATNAPDPDVDFGLPTANFAGDCNLDKQFYDMAIVFDTTFCGDWAGKSYQKDGCPMSASLSSQQSCNEWVARNPEAFEEAYWAVNYIQVYS